MSRTLGDPNDSEGGPVPDLGTAATSRIEPEALPTRAEAEEAVSHAPGAELLDRPREGLGELEALRARETRLTREIEDRDRRVAELERAYRAALRDRELATALAGRPLLPSAAAQLLKLWRDEFDAYEERGEYRVSSRDGRGVGQAVAEWLSQPEYAHFCQPSSRGGAAPLGADRPTPAAPTAPAPRTLGEAAVLRWREAAAQRAQDGLPPVGLGRRR